MKQINYDQNTGILDFSTAKFPAGSPNAGPKFLREIGLTLTDITKLSGWGESYLLIRADAHSDDGDWLPSITDPQAADMYRGYWALTETEAKHFYNT